MSEPIAIERALISVYKKDGVVELARALAAAGVEIISTGGTARLLRESGIQVTPIADVTGFPEMMDGRVKTLHPRVHGGLLMRRDLEHHVSAAKEHDIRAIDLVVVNLYPFGEVVARPDVTEDEAIEMIDIGGPSMVRSAAKNHRFVGVLTDPAHYAEVVASCDGKACTTTLEQRRSWAGQAFRLTSRYDEAIAAWMGRDVASDELPAELDLRFSRQQSLRYGENPHQRAALYRGAKPSEATVAWSRQHSGKELSFNNYLDANAALESVRGLPDWACTVIKHKNPCGAAVRNNQREAFEAAYAGDTLSAFGGIVAFNRPLEADVARLMATRDKFFEVVIAPAYEGDALEILQTGAKWGKNVRLLEVGPIEPARDGAELEQRWIRGGLLVQDPDNGGDVDFDAVTRRKPTDRERADLAIAWELVRHVTSNAIVFVKNRALVGVGAGQMSRVDAVHLAARKAGEKCKGAVMASDAFFPFPDGILTAGESGITAVAQPGGSKNAPAVIAACDEHELAMVFTGRRHFRH